MQNTLVPHSYMYRLLYGDDGVVSPATCTGKLSPPGAEVKWGSVYLDLFMEVSREFQVDWSGLVDGSFISKCGGQKIMLGDYQRMQGVVPWYEGKGFIAVSPDEMMDFATQNTLLLGITARNHTQQQYVKSLQGCLERAQDRCLGCPRSSHTALCDRMCAAKTVRDAGRILGQAIHADDAQACNVFVSMEQECLDQWSHGKHPKADAEGDLHRILLWADHPRAPKPSPGVAELLQTSMAPPLGETTDCPGGREVRGVSASILTTHGKGKRRSGRRRCPPAR
jgi:hypothetical protein